MSGNEKRYFKLFAAQNHTKNAKNYMELYAAMMEMEKYDAEKLKARFEGQSIGKYLSSEKHYLYQLILRSLRAHHAGHSPEAAVHDLLLNARLLHKKGLVSQAAKQLRRAREKARAFELHHLELEILDLQVVNAHFFAEKDMVAHIRDLSETKAALLHKLAQSQIVFSAYHPYSANTRAAAHRKRRPEDLLSEADLSRILVIPDTELTVLARIFRAQLVWQHAHQARDMSAAFEAQQTTVALWEAHPHLIDRSPNRYKIALANLLSAAFFVSRYDLFPGILTKIADLPNASFDEEAEMFQNLFFYRLIWKMNTCAWLEAEALVPEIRAGLKTYAARINAGRHLGFFFNVAVLYLVRGRWSAARRWNREILDFPPTKLREDLQQFAHLLDLILLACQQEFDLLEYRIRAARRHLRKRGVLIEFDRILLRCLQQLCKHPDRFVSPEW
ncbi:MAG: hypothetical protein AAF570_24500, partial [Bacteroidota bacterium]